MGQILINKVQMVQLLLCMRAYGDINMLKLLVKHGAKVDTKTFLGRTALTYWYIGAMFNPSESKIIESLKYLIDSGLDPYEKTEISEKSLPEVRKETQKFKENGNKTKEEIIKKFTHELINVNKKSIVEVITESKKIKEERKKKILVVINEWKNSSP